MLKLRIITALLLAPLVVGSVLWLDTKYLAFIFTLFVCFAGVEWAGLAGVHVYALRVAYAGVVAVALWAVLALVQQREQGAFWVLFAAAVWWMAVGIRLLRLRSPVASVKGVSVSHLLEGLIILVPASLALVALHRIKPYGPVMTLYIFILVWVADIGAYFAGRRWGKTKLAPNISPGKSREGVYGALLCGMTCGLVMSLTQDYGAREVLLFTALCIATVAFSVVGDLFESVIKRQRGVKDSGNLLPGHGGILDRIDSLTAAAPIFVLGLTVMGLLAE